jgi:hypothetical protein
MPAASVAYTIEMIMVCEAGTLHASIIEHHVTMLKSELSVFGSRATVHHLKTIIHCFFLILYPARIYFLSNPRYKSAWPYSNTLTNNIYTNIILNEKYHILPSSKKTNLSLISTGVS